MPKGTNHDLITVAGIMTEAENRTSTWQKAVVGVWLRPSSRREQDMDGADNEENMMVRFDKTAGVVQVLARKSLPFHPELCFDEFHPS